MDRTIVNITSINNKKEYINKENKIEKKKVNLIYGYWNLLSEDYER